MNSNHWQKLKLILAEALEQDSASGRSAVITRSCGGDTDLMHEIESLMAQADATDSLDECADNLAIDVTSEDLADVGQRVGAYVITRKLGEGGMGTVYLAARADGYFEKQVAIKVLKRGGANEEIVRRFRSEREVLARLDHPNIARLMDAGTMDDGRPYFVMEYIEGIPITHFVEDRPATLTEKLDLFLKVSAAVEAAHRNSVIHRDLKPSNILVNHDGEPKLLDFGIAKVVGPKTDPLEITTFRHQRLTPTSASPEQVKGEPVTVFSDIYALGLVLYEMLTGLRPHRFETSHPTDEELAKVVCDQLPLAPSQAITDRERQHQLRGDLDAIVLRALQKEPKQRYSSVAEFADRIRRWLKQHPPEGSTSLFTDRRFRVASAVTAVCLLGVALALLGRSLSNKGRARSIENSAQGRDKITIAVLPFDNLSADKESGYFTDGVQEGVLTDLASVSALKVISRSSVANYRGKQTNAREIARDLGVSYLVEGAVQRTGDRVRVDAQLIDAKTGTAIWAQQYDRKLDDLFDVQSDLAQAIVSQLKGTLSPVERAAMESRPTKDMLAYDLYLRARESIFQNNLQNGAHLLEQAIKRDPQFALGYCLLAQAHLYIYRFTGDRTAGRLEQAKQAAETALRLAPKLPQSHLAKAQYYYYGPRDYQNSMAELIAARKAGGDQAEFVDLSALIERRLGHWQDAINDAQRATELDPQNPFVINELVESYISVRRYTDADRIAEKAIKAAVTRDGYMWGLRTEALLQMGRIDDARAVIENAPQDMTRMQQGVWVALFARDFSRASRILDEATASEKQSFDVAFFQGVIARAQGNTTKAQSFFQTARDRILAKLSERPNDTELIMNLCMADAGLGKRDIALQEAKKLVELRPISADAVDGVSYETTLAMIYEWAGDHDAAFEVLERMVKIPRGPSWGELRFSPIWDDLRNNARFDPLLTQAALPPVYN